MPVVRVSIIRCPPEHFTELRQMMLDSENILAPGLNVMSGLEAFFVGADEATSSLTNVSVWKTLADAQQMDRFQPMLDLGKSFTAKGATFERPIMNYAMQWQIGSATR
jgi:hypothetical protein